jgi:AraC-like DNA-binding protein
MLPVHFLPPKSLEPYIAFYGITDVGEGFHEAYVSPPLGLCGFILSFEGEMNASLSGKLFLKDKYSATGQITEPMIGDITGPDKSLMVFIQPCGLYQLFGIDMSQLTNTSMPLSQLLGKEEADALIEKLLAAADHEKMIAVMNDFFLEQLPVFEIAPKVKEAIDYIHQQKGNVTIKQIEQNCFITIRSLERHFKTYIGLSPKEYAKIFRFKCLVNFINQNPGLTWNTLCEQNGYYDQSHLTRYFNRYMKIKPMDMVSLDMDFINYLLQEP